MMIDALMNEVLPYFQDIFTNLTANPGAVFSIGVALAAVIVRWVITLFNTIPGLDIFR